MRKRKVIVLASASPRRREILEKTGLKFVVHAAEYEEDMDLDLGPRKLARFLSREKAEAVASGYTHALIIAADTFIVYNGRPLGKPHTREDAKRMLKALRGKTHSVITGFTIIDTDTGQRVSRSVETRVSLRNLNSREVETYVASAEPLDKAGAYAIQGLGAVIVKGIEGDYYNVMGLPLSALVENLKKFGVHVL